MRMEIVVVGAGIVGASVAYRLACTGATVTVLDAGRAGGGTSAATFAWINANRKEPLTYYLLNRAGMAEHLLLRRELEDGSWLHVVGNLEWDTQPERLRRKVRRLQERGYDADLVTRAELHALEPDLAAPEDVEEIAYYPSEGYVDVAVLIGLLLRAARERGATIRVGCRVTGLVGAGGRVSGVMTAEGVLGADMVVSCTGRWTDELAQLAGLRVPLAPTAGLLVLTAPVPTRVRSIVHTEEIALRPDGGGRLMLHAEVLDARVEVNLDGDERQSIAAESVRRASRVLPALKDVPYEAVRLGVRAMPVDGVPIVGPYPGLASLYVVCSHSGVTLGPLLGRIVADEIVRSRVDERIMPFRPERLLAG
jgi:glycine/D-amino acid oxidase-like deaminating enzyme